jgi:sigma-B regulation protein RsbU (phosphoserine phosphatase)
MKAAMTALLTSGMIYSKIDEVGSVQEIVTRLNHSLYPKIGRNMFTALCLASINLRTRELTFVNAGLNELVVQHGQRVETVRSEGPRFALGVNRDSVYEEQKRLLGTGDIVLFFTDGLTDMRNARGEFFGMEGLSRVLEEMEAPRLSAAQIKDRIIREVRLFSTDPQPPDDITLVVVKVVG